MSENENDDKQLVTSIKPETTDAVRVIKEVEGAIVMAKKFPRDVNKSYERVITACKRPGVANKAIYSYPRGGKLVRGASIRLAEVLAQNWGNIQYSIREVERLDGESLVEASCWDLETNFHASKVFKVPHIRDTKQGPKKLTDERDIYEIIANMGSRRGRSCITSVIPVDIIEDAISQCEKTLTKSDEPLEVRIRKMILAFKDLGVTQEMLVKRFGHPIETVDTSELVDLISIYNALKDGVAKRQDYFQFTGEVESSNNAEVLVNGFKKLSEIKNGEKKEEVKK